ncbi:MAG: hypothetical protein MZU97_20715 [Bacillus subtilis]|nr:hypothetical protein [Bacillus subtilis]
MLAAVRRRSSTSGGGIAARVKDGDRRRNACRLEIGGIMTNKPTPPSSSRCCESMTRGDPHDGRRTESIVDPFLQLAFLVVAGHSGSEIDRLRTVRRDASSSSCRSRRTNSDVSPADSSAPVCRARYPVIDRVLDVPVRCAAKGHPRHRIRLRGDETDAVTKTYFANNPRLFDLAVPAADVDRRDRHEATLAVGWTPLYRSRGVQAACLDLKGPVSSRTTD